MNPKDPETNRALSAIASALGKTDSPESAKDQLTMFATISICMIHGTYGAEFCRAYLTGALAELDLPNPMKIVLDIVDEGKKSH